jgi:very-short-patch-repair endonuclease
MKSVLLGWEMSKEQVDRLSKTMTYSFGRREQVRRYLTQWYKELIVFLEIDECFAFSQRGLEPRRRRKEGYLTETDVWPVISKIMYNDEFIQLMNKKAFTRENQKLPNKSVIKVAAKLMLQYLQPRLEEYHNIQDTLEKIRNSPPPIKKTRGSVGNNERACLEHLESVLGIEIVPHVKIDRKIIDGYISELKLFIEFNEPYHYTGGKLRSYDEWRMNHILSFYPDHSFYIIKEKDWLRNSDKVIEELKGKIKELKAA